jgi:hypothetical protein
VDSLGHIMVEGTACDEPGRGNRLTFTLEQLDQSYLPKMLSELREIEHEVPLRGELED